MAIHLLTEVGDWNGLKKNLNANWCQMDEKCIPERYPRVAVTYEGRGRGIDYQVMEAQFVYFEDVKKLLEAYEVWHARQIQMHKDALEKLTGKKVEL